MIIQTDKKYEQLDYKIEPQSGLGSFKIAFIADHKVVSEYSNCDANYLRALGKSWVKYGYVHIPEID